MGKHSEECRCEIVTDTKGRLAMVWKPDCRVHLMVTTMPITEPFLATDYEQRPARTARHREESVHSGQA